ncbi:hypothetical protein PQU92_01540 [Asticcacaulis sp. BYS171W]|uniref:Lipoprotein n=1 Tax=Asticcacaulis aquaticus TaxID=2984212 RepID=A0ABT5HPF1_9CAUL|nr:hypothetical protein [Asticcacaulis aquaticus]MDC7681940.1 hypothetical protein [Asticcacaulis aquaticus]
MKTVLKFALLGALAASLSACIIIVKDGHPQKPRPPAHQDHA